MTVCSQEDLEENSTCFQLVGLERVGLPVRNHGIRPSTLPLGLSGHEVCVTGGRCLIRRIYLGQG